MTNGNKLLSIVVMKWPGRGCQWAPMARCAQREGITDLRGTGRRRCGLHKREIEAGAQGAAVAAARARRPAACCYQADRQPGQLAGAGTSGDAAAQPGGGGVGSCWRRLRLLPCELASISQTAPGKRGWRVAEGVGCGMRGSDGQPTARSSHTACCRLGSKIRNAGTHKHCLPASPPTSPTPA